MTVRRSCRRLAILLTMIVLTVVNSSAFAQVGSTQPEAGKSVGTERFKSNFSHATLSGVIDPAAAAPGSVAHLVITAEPAKDWHIYALADKDPKDVSKPTLIVLTNTSGLRYKAPTPSSPPVEEATTVNQAGKVLYYDKPISWTIDLEVPKEAKPGVYKLAGIIGYQTCEATACDMPLAAVFEGELGISEKHPTGSKPLLFREGKYSEAAKLAEAAAKPADQGASAIPAPTTSGSSPPGNELQSNSASVAATGPLIKVRVIGDEQDAHTGLATVLVSAFFGGLILNLMPCVLPVMGLKLLSFVEQSHHHRSRVLMLNIWYSLGLMAVFLVLATLACGASLGLRDQNLSWGEQFSSTAFNIVLCGIVFAMALSFLGIWEIPIPGFIGSGKAAAVATHEGAVGAFTKGVVSTVLATPCSGPLLGSVFGFTLQQSPGVIYAIFAMIGLGMASPYLLIGAFPQLIRILPKPGAWMDTFKHVMGFVLLGTVVFLFTFLNRDYLVPTFAMLVGIWAACWWIGHVPLTAETGRKLKAWAQGAALAAAVGYFSFTWLVPHDALLPWQPFSTEALSKYRAEGKTVMLDFTADWCLTCKTNLKFAINTQDVLKVIEANKIVPLLAQWNEDISPQLHQEIKDTLTALNRNSIPALAIFPADRPDEAIVLHDLISKGQLVEALQKAGPSKSAPAANKTVME